MHLAISEGIAIARTGRAGRLKHSRRQIPGFLSIYRLFVRPPDVCTEHGTSLPKVIWEEGRVGALSHTSAAKSPLVYNGAPQIRPQSTPSRGPIPKSHYLPHPWTRPTYDVKQHPDPMRRFATMHWTDRPTDAQTNRPTDRSRERLTTIDLCATRATRPNNGKEQSGSFLEFTNEQWMACGHFIMSSLHSKVTTRRSFLVVHPVIYLSRRPGALQRTAKFDSVRPNSHIVTGFILPAV